MNTDALSCNVSSSSVMVDEDSTNFTKPDYEQLYNDLLKKHEILKNESSSQKHELLSIKKTEVDYQKINESLRCSKEVLQSNFNKTKLLLTQTQKEMTKQIKLLSKNNSRTADAEVRKCLSTLFSKNQIDLVMKKKKIVHWSTDDISKAFTLRYFSKRAYIYVKDELHYPLPGK